MFFIKLEIAFCPALELLNSLDVFLKNQFKKSDFSKSWVKSVTNDLSPELFKALSSEENMNNLSLLKLLTATNVKQINNLTDFFVWLEKLECDKESVSEFVTRQFGIKVHPTFWNFTCTVRDWHKQYFANVEQHILTQLEDNVIADRGLLVTEEKLNIIEKLTNGIRLVGYSNLEKVILIPQHHGFPINLISKYPNTHIYCYPSFCKNSDEPDQLITLSMKAMSDNNRLKILRFIMEQERTFTDIQKYTNLARSTVHYHIVMLRSAGLIKILSSPEDIDKFQFRSIGLESVQEKLQEYLKG